MHWGSVTPLSRKACAVSGPFDKALCPGSLCSLSEQGRLHSLGPAGDPWGEPGRHSLSCRDWAPSTDFPLWLRAEASPEPTVPWQTTLFGRWSSEKQPSDGSQCGQRGRSIQTLIYSLGS